MLTKKRSVVEAERKNNSREQVREFRERYSHREDPRDKIDVMAWCLVGFVAIVGTLLLWVAVFYIVQSNGGI